MTLCPGCGGFVGVQVMQSCCFSAGASAPAWPPQNFMYAAVRVHQECLQIYPCKTPKTTDGSAPIRQHCMGKTQAEQAACWRSPTSSDAKPLQSCCVTSTSGSTRRAQHDVPSPSWLAPSASFVKCCAGRRGGHADGVFASEGMHGKRGACKHIPACLPHVHLNAHTGVALRSAH